MDRGARRVSNHALPAVQGWRLRWIFPGFTTQTQNVGLAQARGWRVARHDKCGCMEVSWRQWYVLLFLEARERGNLVMLAKLWRSAGMEIFLVNRKTQVR